ncbi:MAG: Tetratricopeptide 2 repeat protein [Pedosphaera sp.]|nr:Tetratricopeptide 2 repeat protein [Pedosphaera sp.]
MKKYLSVFSLGALLVLCGCVTTKVHEIDLTGDIMVDGPRAIAEGPARDKVLWEYRVAAAAMRRGDYPQAKHMLDDALLTLGGIYGKDPTAKKARSYFTEENKKTFIGEPYERVMAYYYRGILYWMDGEPDNARACFRTGQLEDSSSEGEQYNADYVLLDYLDGFASTKLGDDGSEAFQRAEKLSKKFAKPPSYDKQANVLIFLEFGPGPRKYAAGHYREELHFTVPESPAHSAVIKFESETIHVGPYDDLGFQATTRGGRVMDHVLANKAVFKTTTDAAGNAAIIGGAIAASSRNQTSEEVGLGLIAAGIISKVVSATTTPAADIRTWDNLPRYLSFTALDLPPGPHTATVEFQDRFGQPLPNLTKTITINVPADKHDKVVFVSDTSTTPQNL